MDLHKITWWLLIIGGLNWLLVGAGSFLGGYWNVVYMIFGSWPALEGLVYVLVGLAAAYQLFGMFSKNQSMGGGAQQQM